MDSVETSEIDTPSAPRPVEHDRNPARPSVKPPATVRRRTLLLAALAATGAAVPVAVMESRANSAGPRTTVFPLPHGHAGSVAFSPDGKTLAAGLSGVQGIHSTLRLWDVARGTATTPWPDQVEELTKVAFSPDGKTLAMTGTFAVSLWNVADRTAIALPHPRPTLDLAFAPDGRTLASGGRDGTARLWDLPTHTLTTMLTTQGMAEVDAVAFSPDGRTLATDSDDLTESPVRLWDLRTHTVATTLDAPRRHGFNPVAFPSKGTIMATGSADNIVRVWDSGTSYVYAPLTGHTGPVTTVAFSPDGDTLATGSEDRTVRLWDTSSLDVFPLDTLTGHTDKVTTLAFSPDGKTLASGSLDATVRLWPTR
ncbi:WD40 repeat domain-containing protein [Streptomyces canus]|uniref:WD40 repeat domain-containing protein n=1 Tax=Streptomyces canus TaxID=58343 RepID=UPI00225BD4BF|nr:WD40 repeat domain-containing protein [Streptomyces canus]MCX4854446.1 WD40 repeat domain-containing protein [Streptomyces canus]